MTGPLQLLGATDTEKQLLLGVCILSGVVLLVTSVAPDVGEALTATGLIFTAMVFVGSGLVYLCLLPVQVESA